MAPPTNGQPPNGPRNNTSRLPGRQGQPIHPSNQPPAPVASRAPSAGTPPLAKTALPSISSTKYDQEVEQFTRDLLDLHKSSQHALHPEKYGYLPEVTRQSLAYECRRSSRSLLRVVASAGGVPSPSLDELEKKLLSSKDESKLGQMEGWMKEMKDQMAAMQRKQDELAAENQALKEAMQSTKVELKKSVETAQQAYSQGLSGAVRAELTGDLSKRLEAAIKPEANKFVHSIFAQKVMEITGNMQGLLGDAWQQGYQAFANDNGNAPPPQPNTNPHRGGHPPPPPPPSAVDTNGNPVPQHGASDLVTQAQLRETKTKLYGTFTEMDKSMNAKLEKMDERIKGKLDRMQSRIKAAGASTASAEASPVDERNGAGGAAARKRARIDAEEDATMQGVETDDAEAAAREVTARKALAEEVGKIKKDLAALKAQVDAQAKAPPPPPPAPTAIEPVPLPAAPSAASLANYVLKFTYSNKIEELDAQIEELEKASQSTNKLVREQKAKLLENFEQQLEDVKDTLGSQITTAAERAARASSSQPPPISIDDVITQVDTRIQELALDSVEDRLSAVAQDVLTLDQNVKRFEDDIVENVKVINATQQEVAELKTTHEEDYRAVQMLVETSGTDLMAKMEKSVKEMDLGERVGTVVKDEVAAVLSGESVQRLMQPGLEKVEQAVEKRVSKVEEDVKEARAKVALSDGNVTRHETRLTNVESSRTETTSYITKIDQQLQSVGQSMRGVLQFLSQPPPQPQPQPSQHAASPTQQFSAQQQQQMMAAQQQQHAQMGAMYQVQQQPR